MGRPNEFVLDMATPKTNLVILLGGGLLAANVAFDQQFNGLRTEVSAGTFSTETATGSPVKMVLVGLVTLMALTVVSDDNDTAANTILIALLCFWLLWLISYKNQGGAVGGVSTTHVNAAGQTINAQGGTANTPGQGPEGPPVPMTRKAN